MRVLPSFIREILYSMALVSYLPTVGNCVVCINNSIKRYSPKTLRVACPYILLVWPFKTLDGFLAGYFQIKLDMPTVPSALSPANASLPSLMRDTVAMYPIIFTGPGFPVLSCSS